MSRLNISKSRELHNNCLIGVDTNITVGLPAQRNTCPVCVKCRIILIGLGSWLFVNASGPFHNKVSARFACILGEIGAFGLGGHIRKYLTIHFKVLLLTYKAVHGIAPGADPGGGARGPWPPPPSPQNIAPPNSQARIQGGGAKRALAPPGVKRALPPPPLTKSWIRLCAPAYPQELVTKHAPSRRLRSGAQNP